MGDARQELAAVLREARALLALPDNDFAWASWANAGAALAEVDKLVAALEAGRLPSRLTVSVLRTQPNNRRATVCSSLSPMA